MAAPPLMTLSEARIGFGDKLLFADLELQLGRGDRACLVGRNGSGKSTLLKIMAGLVELDAGELFRQPGAKASYLPQDPAFDPEETVADHVAADGAPPHRVDAMLAQVELDGARRLGTLSGGEGRRTALARALVGDPEILLLDEPTNHLDLAAIDWLERVLGAFTGALLMVSHDRAFLNRVTTRTFWLDHGHLRRNDQGFADFDRWSEAVLEAELREAEKLDSKLRDETRWLLRGVTARRRRNQGRLRKLETMRAARAALLGGQRGSAKMAVEDGEIKSRLVIEAKDIAKSFSEDGQERVIVRGFSTRVLRGDRIGIVGANGAGKTTLLRMLTGDLEPDRGSVRLAKNLTSAYFDQHRATLNREKSLWETLCPAGGDQVMVHGQPRHVRSYLKDFLFDPRQAESPVGSLSGGERNRLLLAKIMAMPSELLVLDEPTNDLDMDTLDLLQEMLAEYPGTLLLVSHDRDFLDKTVSSTIVMEGDGSAVEYAGGYSDYVAQRKARAAPRAPEQAKRTDETQKKAAPRDKPRQRLGYKDQRDLDLLPERVAALEAEIKELEAALGDATLYQRDRAAFERATARIAEARAELDAAETRWLELDARREALAQSSG
ncbi:MAG: ABC-F family ATP-binding cassette domain-containing protein [Candidatus Eiseniibacteriota bacterium]